MAQVTVTMNGRAYRMACGDGEEARLAELAGHVEAKVNNVIEQFGQVGEERLFLMAALLVADELFEARARLDAGDPVGESAAGRSGTDP